MVWLVVAAGALFWGLKLFVRPPALPNPVAVAMNSAAPAADLTRLLGADPPPQVDTPPDPGAAARFQLLGVVAPRGERGAAEGVALIAVDGKLPRAYRVGAAVDGDTVLQAVRARGASLGPRGGAAAVSLEIPPPAPAATGALPGTQAPIATLPPAFGAAPPVAVPPPAGPTPIRPFPRVGGKPVKNQPPAEGQGPSAQPTFGAQVR